MFVLNSGVNRAAAADHCGRVQIGFHCWPGGRHKGLGEEVTQTHTPASTEIFENISLNRNFM